MAERPRTVAEERAAAQAQARALRAERRAGDAASAATTPNGPVAGSGLVRFSLVSTSVFVVSAVAATVVEPGTGRMRDVLVIASVVVALALGLAGVGLFVAALAWGAARSRDDELTMSGWWFLTGDVAPAAVRRTLLGCLAVQVVVGFATASIRLYTELAFGTLVPICALAVCGAWSARYGEFPRRAPSARDRRPA